MKRFIQTLLIGSKWVLPIFYVGLTLVLMCYSLKFCCLTFDLLRQFWTMSESECVLAVLTLVDITMVANLLKLIIVGSYHNFVEPIKGDSTEHVTSDGLKIKMTGSLIGISSIHVMQSFMNPATESTRDLLAKCGIHALFLFSILILSVVSFLHTKCNKLENNERK